MVRRVGSRAVRWRLMPVFVRDARWLIDVLLGGRRGLDSAGVGTVKQALNSKLEIIIKTC